MRLLLDFGPHLDTHPGLTLRLAGAHLTDEQFADVCKRNEGWRLEREPNGDLTVRPLLGGVTGIQVALLNAQLSQWAERTGEAVALDTGAGIRLRNGAIRAPSASCVNLMRWEGLHDSERDRCRLPFCPDFIAEVVSPWDDRVQLIHRMREYLEGGARLGWLIDPSWRTVDVFRPGEGVKRVSDVTYLTEVHPSPVLPGFVLDLRRLWNAGQVGQAK